MKPYVLRKSLLLIFTIIIITSSSLFVILPDKEITFVIANKLTQNIPDLIIKLDNEIIIKDSINKNSISECLVRKTLDFGYHHVFIESKSANIQQKISLLSILDSNLYILVQRKEKQQISIDKTTYYLFKPVSR